MDIAQTRFETPHKIITLLDAPGHKDFIPNMITGMPALLIPYISLEGWSGGAMVLGKLPVLGHPTNMNNRALAYCTCNGCWWGLDIFTLIYHFSLLSPSLLETARFRLKYCL